MILQFFKIHADVKLPERKNPSDAGADVRWFSPEIGSLTISPGESVILKTGLKVHIPHGYCMLVQNRSGMASQKSLKVGACVIDAGYDGEILINLHNDGNTPQQIAHDDRVAQLLLVPVIHFVPVAVPSEGELYRNPLYISNRGSGGFGSTGNN